MMTTEKRVPFGEVGNKENDHQFSAKKRQLVDEARTTEVCVVFQLICMATHPTYIRWKWTWKSSKRSDG